MIMPAQGSMQEIPIKKVKNESNSVEVLKELADIKEILLHLLEFQMKEFNIKYGCLNSKKGGTNHHLD